MKHAGGLRARDMYIAEIGSCTVGTGNELNDRRFQGVTGQCFGKFTIEDLDPHSHAGGRSADVFAKTMPPRFRDCTMHNNNR